MKTLQLMRGQLHSVTNVLALGLFLLGCGGRADGNIYYATSRTQASEVQVLHSKSFMQMSKYSAPEILLPNPSGQTMCACIRGGSQQQA